MQRVRADQPALQEQRRGADDVLDVVQAQQFGLQRDDGAGGRHQLEAGDLADHDALRMIAGAGLQPVPDHLAARRQPVQRLMGPGAHQQAVLGRQGDQLGEWGLVGLHGGEDVQMVVDQRRDQHVAWVVELELRAPVLGADDVLVALDQELGLGPAVAGSVQVQRDGADEIAGVAPRLAHQHRAHGGQGGFAEAAGDDQVLAVPGMAAQELGEAVARQAPADDLGELGIGLKAELGAGADDRGLGLRGDQPRVEAHVIGDAQAVQIGRHRREHPVVRARDGVAFGGQHRGQGAHAGAGDPEEIDVHAGGGPLGPLLHRCRAAVTGSRLAAALGRRRMTPLQCADCALQQLQ